MSSQNAGRQSPEPERQSGKQQQDTPADGQGVSDKGAGNKDESEKTLEVSPIHHSKPLESNLRFRDFLQTPRVLLMITPRRRGQRRLGM